MNISSVPEGAAGGMGMSGHGSHGGHPGHVTQNNIGQGQKCKLEWPLPSWVNLLHDYHTWNQRDSTYSQGVKARTLGRQNERNFCYDGLALTYLVCVLCQSA